jgi:Leucine-rich repeat (LRR) protein
MLPPLLLFPQPLSRLEVLDVHHNHIQDLSPIQHLTGLRVLHAGYNQLKSLPRLQQLAQLQELNLRHNKLTAITCLCPAQAPESSSSVPWQQLGPQYVFKAHGPLQQHKLQHQEQQLQQEPYSQGLESRLGGAGPSTADTGPPQSISTRDGEIAFQQADGASRRSVGADASGSTSSTCGGGGCSSRTTMAPCLALPSSLQHLLLDHNQLPSLQGLLPLRGLGELVSLSLNHNPLLNPDQLPAGVDPCEVLLQCCPVGLITLDGRQVGMQGEQGLWHAYYPSLCYPADGCRDAAIDR